MVARLSLVLLLVASALSAQAPVASTATAEGWEGLFYNPAALGFHHYQLTALDGSWSSDGAYGLRLALLDNLAVGYRNSAGVESWSLAGGLGFPLAHRLFAGLAATVDPSRCRWEELVLDTGLLYLPARFLALGASQRDLLHPADRLFSFGVGIRPFTERLTFFGDLLVPATDPTAGWELAFGLRAEPADGVELGFRTDRRFAQFLASLRLYSGRTYLDLLFGGDYGLSRYSAGAGLGYSLLPARSVLGPRPRKYRLQLARPLERNRTRRGSLYAVESLVARLNELAEDRSCRTLILSFDSTVIRSFDVLEELLGALARCKAKGKQVVTFVDNSFSQLDYLAAAAGSTVVLSPGSVVMLTGVGGEFLFLKGLFERLGIGLDYARSSEYKSALDRFLSDSLSEENRAQLTEYLATAYGLIRETLVSARGFTADRAAELIDGGPYLAEEAVSLGLADEVLYRSEFEKKYLADRSAPALTYLSYRERSWRRPAVAVIKAAGPIVNAQALTPWDRLSGAAFITDRGLIQLLEAVAGDGEIAAVVLQIDSPGGDGLASDRIWKAIEELKERKPVTVVMGATAASGGYYLAMTGVPVFARRTTLTGSIGSFMFKLTIDRLLERYGVTTDSIKLGENYDFFSPFHPLTEEQQARMRAMNRAFEEQFYRKVAAARSLSIEEVRRLGSGRIYSGGRALELRLVDRLGGIPEALQYIEKKLDLGPGDYRLVYLPDWGLRLRLALKEMSEQGLSVAWLLAAVGSLR